MTASKIQNTLIELVSDGNIADLRSAGLCEAFSECFSGNKAVIITTDDEDQPTVSSCGTEIENARAYEQHFYKLDPMSNCRSPNVPLKMSDTLPRKQFEASEFYNDFFKPMDSYYSLSLARQISGERGLEVAIARSRQSPDFNARDKRLLKSITARLAARVGILEAQTAIPQAYRAKKLDLLSTLSERELEVFLHISSGNSLNEFQEKNGISINTARTLLKSVRTKLECDSQLELARIARAIA